jgi:serine/threonine-protein kinase
MKEEKTYIGKTVGKYRIEEQIGRGAMAEVYRAYNPNLDRFVAIKILHPHLSKKTDILGRFRREAKNVASLYHKNIVQIHDFDLEGSVYYMVMEFINGPTLKDLIKEARSEKRLIPFERTLSIIKDIGAGLEYAHKNGVVHRDVKPANVMMDDSNRVILTDFGLAKFVSGTQFTTTGAMIGTPAYMSPEQGLGQPGDARSDLYSMGVILYQLTTGRLPFVAETPLAIVFKHVNAPLTPPRSINSNIPESLEEVIIRSMAKNPEERYQTVEDLMKSLGAVTLDDFNSVAQNGPTTIPPFTTPTLDIVNVTLHVVETGELLTLEDNTEFVLGRSDEKYNVHPDVDLTPFEAYKKGVSRRHAAIKIGNKNEVSLVDLESTNGTWLNGAKVSPQIPIPLHQGDIIALGKLALQVFIRI